MMNTNIRSCHLSRRRFLHVGSATLLGVSLVDRLRLQSRGAEAGAAPKARACIQIWLSGGPATIDMWDMKPDAVAEIRGEFRPIATSVPGMMISEHLPRLAQALDRVTIVRSMQHTLADHDPGTELVMTGRAPTAALKYPTLGAVASRLLTASSGIPSYIALGSDVLNQSGFLGAAHQPFVIREAELSGRDLRAPVELPEGFSVDDLTRRDRLLQGFDQRFAELDAFGLSSELKSFEHQALDILRSNKTRRALDLASEPEQARSRYGAGWIGSALLAARRLVEAGVGYVTAGMPGWDTHADNFAQLRNQLLPQLDQGLAALIEDLDERSLLDSTLVYCAGEFGRTPFVNGQAGRDHWARAMSVLVAGGGIRRGSIWGATDERGTEVIADPCSPAGMNATLLQQLGFTRETMLETSSGRPIAAMGDGVPMQGLVS